MTAQAFAAAPRGPGSGAPPRPPHTEREWVAAAFGFAVLVPFAVAVWGAPVLVGLAACVVLLVVARFPAAGVYLYLVTLPFLAGIDRGTALPLVRPNEAVLALVVAGALLGGYVRHLTTPRVRRPRSTIDGPLLAFAVVAVVWPVTWLLLRGRPPAGPDLAALLPVVKLAGLFLLVRTALRSERQLAVVTRLVLWPAGVVAVVTVLQTLRVDVVLSVLRAHWAGGTTLETLTERGTATLGSAIAVGDYLLVALALLLGGHARRLLIRGEAGTLGVLCAAGLMATGQFSAWIGAVLVAVVLRRRFTARGRLSLVPLLPLLLVALLAGLPAVLGRLAQFGDGGQASWAVRWANLSTFYLPRLTGSQLLLGVEPSSVLPAPETWRTTVYLESGYLGMLWLGGVPLLAAFGWLSVTVFRHLRPLTGRPDLVGAHADALRAAWWLVVVLSLLDAHLFLRGTGDLLAVLLAVSSGALAGPSVAVAPKANARPWSNDPYPPSHALVMRAVDVVLAATALLLLAPAMVAVAHLVRAGSSGPALFRQERLGLRRRPFVMLKFRTMRPGSSDAAHRAMIMAEVRGADTSTAGSWKLDDDPRVTRLGDLLRRTSVDELPQLLNVLSGRMSLVGPRPCLGWEADVFPPEAAERFAVKPGLTGLWQVSGRSTMGTLDMLRLDVEYVRTRTLRGDLSILLRTVPSMLRGGGAR